MNKLIIFFIIAAFIGGGWMLSRRTEKVVARTFDSFVAQQGEVTDHLRETGFLEPDDPLLVKAPFEGRLKWVLKDGSWVKPGDPILIFGEEELVEDVTDMRARVVSKRQDLQLAKLKAEHAEIAELKKVKNAQRELDLAEIDHRVLTTQPIGGDRLIEIHAVLQPMEKKQAELQEKIEPLERTFRAARDHSLELMQKWLSARGTLLEKQARVDFKYASEVDRKVATGAPVKAGRAEVERLEGQLAEAKKAEKAAEAPYARVRDAIAEVEAEAREQYVLLEIEKRGLPATKLRIDTEVAKLRLAEAKRQADSGARALAVGAMSASRHERLLADVKEAESRLEILGYQLKIAERPAEEDKVAESAAALAAAKQAVADAQSIFEREMDIQKGEIDLAEAELAELEGKLSRMSHGFAEAIRGSVAMAKEELTILGDDEGERRAELIKRLGTLEQELKVAEADPPNIVKAPIAGLLRLNLEDDRPTDVGDEWDEGETVAMIFPPGNMKVKAGVNEVNSRRVQIGQQCAVTIPALSLEIPDGEVTHVAQIGRDKTQSDSFWRPKPLSGVIQFQLTVDPKQSPDSLRQGMTVFLEIVTGRKSDVVHLPAAAVVERGGNFVVWTAEDITAEKIVEGAYWGDNRFIVTKGVSAGETVYRPYGGGAL